MIEECALKYGLLIPPLKTPATLVDRLGRKDVGLDVISTEYCPLLWMAALARIIHRKSSVYAD